MLDVACDRSSDGMAGMHELDRFERKRAQPFDADVHRLACASDVGEAIDNGDHLYLAADCGRHPGRHRNRLERRRRGVDWNYEMVEHGGLLYAFVICANRHQRPIAPTGPLCPLSGDPQGVRLDTRSARWLGRCSLAGRSWQCNDRCAGTTWNHTGTYEQHLIARPHRPTSSMRAHSSHVCSERSRRTSTSPRSTATRACMTSPISTRWTSST